MTDPTGSPCRNCPEGRYKEGTTSELMEREGTTLVVKEVPAYVCDTCGSDILSAKIVEQLQEMLEESVRSGIESEVRTWRAPVTAA